jgi:hypothetical protein
MAKRRPDLGHGTVAFLDDGQQGALFDPFAATLRRRGIRTLRIATGPGGAARRLRDRLFYTRVLPLPSADTDVRLAEVLAAHGVGDVQLGEATLARLGLGSAAVRSLADRALACSTLAPWVMYDKFALNARLAEAGLRTPPQLDAAEVTAEEAAGRLGLPLMVKRRTAEGGRGVRLAPTAAAAREVLAQWKGLPGGVFFQAYIPGELVMYGALVGPGGILVEHGFRATELQARYGPSARLQLHDDADVLQAGRRITAALGLRGLAQLDFIRDATGGLWHLDANPRCWSSLLTADACGAGFVAAYAALVRGAAAPSLTARPRRDEVPVQPYSFLAAAASGPPERLPAAWRAFAAHCAAGPGVAYAALMFLKGLQAAAARLPALARRAPPTGAPGRPRLPGSAPPSARR